MAIIVSSDLLKASLSILPVWLESQWQQRMGTQADNGASKKLYADLVGSLTQIRRNARNMTGQTTGPYLALAVAEISLNRNRFNNHALLRHGIVAGRSENQQRVRLEHLAAVNVGVALRFTCNDKLDQLTFASILLEQSAKGNLGVRLKNPLGFSFECSLNFSDNLSLGDQDSEDSKNQFVLETTVILSTFTGTITETGVIKTIELGMAAGNLATPNADSATNVSDFTGYDEPEITKLSYIDKYDSASPHYWKMT